MPLNNIRQSAFKVLMTKEPAEKARLAHEMAGIWSTDQQGETNLEKTDFDITPANVPGRPKKPELINPRDMKRRRLGSPEGRIALMHAIAHIEFNAINLAADMLARFMWDDRIAPERRREFVADWVTVCDDEARHFTMINDQLVEMGSFYGALPAHDGLWDAAVSTMNDLAARLVIAPMVLEARGLDVTPKMIINLTNVGDIKSADILTTIYNEEIAHVAAGARWFTHLCDRENRDETEYFRALLAEHFTGGLKPPFNVEARNLAGLNPDFYASALARN
jgi:uncharacterized ferritin-like protein (DUF455 family)